MTLDRWLFARIIGHRAHLARQRSAAPFRPREQTPCELEFDQNWSSQSRIMESLALNFLANQN
jgi:hypothetical protein